MNTALIGLDYIVDIMHPRGRIARSAAHSAQRAIIERFNTALEIVHADGGLTILVRVGFDGGYAAVPKRSPMFGQAQQLGALDLTGGGCDYHPDLHSELARLTMVKPRVSGFYGTPLDSALRANAVERVAIAGVSSTWAVASTVRDAHDRDYEVVVLEDACAAPSQHEHDQAMETLRSIATVTTVAAFIAEL
jgi:biuret amidohydrolase